MQIEEGKCYRTRDGRKVGPMSIWDGVFQREKKGVLWHQGHKKPWYWLPNGKNGEPENEIPELDLIAEWKDEPTGPVTIETVKRINTGTFKRVHVTPINDDFVSLHLQGQTFNATELRDISELATQLADALEGK